MVVFLTSPRLNGDELTFRAIRLHEIHDPTRKGKQWTRPIAPNSMSGIGLYIDPVEYIINGPGLG